MTTQHTFTVKATSFSVTLIFCLASLSASLPIRDTASPQAVIVNGTSVGTGFKQDTFLFCKCHVEDTGSLHLYHVMWQDLKGEPVRRWSKEAKVFALGSYHVPHSYLVFHDFSGEVAGDYSCALYLQGSKIHSSTVTVTLLHEDTSIYRRRMILENAANKTAGANMRR
jgi:hypothetical protein